jgi:hypothetical protein
LRLQYRGYSYLKKLCIEEPTLAVLEDLAVQALESTNRARFAGGRPVWRRVTFWQVPLYGLPYGKPASNSERTSRAALPVSCCALTRELALMASHTYTLGGSFFAFSTVQHDDGSAPHLHQVHTPL